MPLKYSGVNFKEYKNHSGVVDAYTQVGVTESGTATPDPTNHEMDLASVGFGGKAKFETIATFTLGVNPITCNFIIQNWSKGTGGVPTANIGLRNDFLSDSFANTITFLFDAYGIWNTRTSNASDATTTPITALVSGDSLKIIATSSEVKFYVNNALVATHTTYIPTALLNMGAHVVSTSSTSVAITVSIDYMAIKYPLGA